MTDFMVDSGEIPIAVRDYGGDGPAMLLLHGGGGTMAGWDVAGPLLAADFRPVAVDLRGHGKSGDGPWSWDAVVTDLEAVVSELGLRNPAVVGHSLGGGIGAWWAVKHPECPALVNLDGHRAPVTAEEHYDAGAAGISDAELRAKIAQLNAQFDQMEAELATAQSRPGPEIAKAIRADMKTDSLPMFAQVTVPFLLVLATRSLPQLAPELEPLMVAFRAGLRRDLAALPNVEIREVDASHGVLFEKPAEVAAIATEFVRKAS
ncbi:alpha/beta fold hydrolase [Fodinicola acaciae]|uniref:alpha/beta fold hydrolase n=1 Tax=Fodinicola acaciae TaxID=2681555 RepID=UPI0013D5C729|nr:alpha/beta hydrolase [Fodinicola acaciae]